MAIRLHAPAFLLGRSQLSRVQRDFDCLLERMRQRLYPETMQVLALYWLKAIWVNGYKQTEWEALDHLLRQALADTRTTVSEAVQSLRDLREWIEQIRHRNGQRSLRPRARSEQTRQVSSDSLVLYLFRLLNEWLPVEVAHLLASEESDQSGIPMVVVARAIERLLVREHLSRATLESMLSPGLLSPRIVYPAEAEILQDVVLFLLGRTGTPAPARLPAALLCVAPDATLSSEYAEAFSGAILTRGISGAEELHVPIPSSQADELVKMRHVRITSAGVTMDGQLWQADKLQRGEQASIVYGPAGRLRIDYSGDHARMILPWPEAHWRWDGPVSFTNRVEMFGREWHISHWEQDADRTLLHLVFGAPLAMAAIEPSATTNLRRSHPAGIDMAWAALERALEASLARRSLEPVEQLRRGELVPLGRALFGLAESVKTRGLREREAINKRLNGIRYLSVQLLSAYGPVPWRILPEAVRKALLTDRMYMPLTDLFHEVFEGVPEGRGDGVPWGGWSNGSLRRLWNRRSLRLGSSSPSRAA
jgi:hypothetical protein